MVLLSEDHSNKPLVSIIIPCYNAERWLSHAILSCLEQTYRPIEIIVIDDGSTDASLDIIKSYDKAITWEAGPNRGGNAARNRGFALSKGKYIQFLDADDYLLPEKVAHDAAFLEETGADVVFGDKFIQEESPTPSIAPKRYSSQQPPKDDMLEALLSGFIVNTPTLFFRREVISKVGGWDETLRAAQERDLLISSIIIGGANARYHPGAFNVKVVKGSTPTVSSNPQRTFTNYEHVLNKAEQHLAQLGKLSVRYQQAMANSYFLMARAHFYYYRDPIEYNRLLQRALSLNPALHPGRTSPPQKRFYVFLYNLFGFAGADQIADSRRRLVNRTSKIFKS
jgi:glycosyltransferase involved in cell wall biosynthesis